MNRYSKFINVYHFAPLSYEICDRQNPINDREENREPLYTGKIQVRLRTRTPVFIPDTHAQGREEGHKEYSFFSYDGKTPVIPGSSLRGMLRSVYETVTNSCLSVVDLDEKPVRRTNDYYKAGLLRRNTDGTFSLVKAEKATIRYNNRPDLNAPGEFREGTEVWVKVQQQGQNLIVTDIIKSGKEEMKEEWRQGYYFKGEPGMMKGRGGRPNAYVMCRIQNKNENENKEDEICPSMNSDSIELQELKSVLESYQALAEKKNKGKDNKVYRDDSGENSSVSDGMNKTTGVKHEGYREYRESLKTFLGAGYGTDYFPVHYSRIGRGKEAVTYLSPACITKEISYNTILDILKKQGEHHSCSDIRKLCPACRLFGMVGKNKKVDKADKYPNAWASSIRVQDACLKEESREGLFGKKITLMELSEPKKSSTEFYLEKPEGESILSWAYDYYLDGRYNTVIKYTPKISGRKYYWHHQTPNLPEKNVKKTERNCTVVPLNERVNFSFPVYFERVTRRQMEQLIWLCNISALAEKNGQPVYGYKIGKGKPLGMGSIELAVEEVKIRCLENNGRLGYHLKDYRETFGQDFQDITYEEAGFDAQVKEAFLRLCRFDAVEGIPVTYPVSDRQSVKIARDGYKWFTYNRYNNNRKGGNNKITKRNELVFEQHLTPLDGDSDITLYVNGERERGYPNAEAYSAEGVAANDKLYENTSRKAGGAGGTAGNQERKKNGRPENSKHFETPNEGKKKGYYRKNDGNRKGK